MPCPDILNTQAFIDGEVAGDAALAAERHLETCAECQAFVMDAATLGDAIRKAAVRHTAPASLRQRVAEALGQDESRQARIRSAPAKLNRRSFWSGAFGGAGVTGLAAIAAALVLAPPSANDLVTRVTEAHTHALAGGQEIAVLSSNHHTVKPWFAGKIDISPPVADFAAQGYRLAGGRLDRTAGFPAAVVVYQHGLHEIDLFVWADRGGALPQAGLHHGYRSMFWKTGDLDFAAVSDTGAAELATFVGLVRAEPE